MNRSIPILILCCLSGCRASYFDERPAIDASVQPALEAAMDAALPLDLLDSASEGDAAAVADAASKSDSAVPTDGGVKQDLAEIHDLAAPRDLTAPPPPDLSPFVLSQGTFVGRAGHAGRGTAQLIQLAGGAVDLNFLSDFAVSGVPGPVVYLSSRSSLTGGINAATDIRIGTLKSSSGAQSYRIPAGAEVGRRYAWVWCEPFRVEVAVAPMSP